MNQWIKGQTDVIALKTALIILTQLCLALVRPARLSAMPDQPVLARAIVSVKLCSVKSIFFGWTMLLTMR